MSAKLAALAGVLSGCFILATGGGEAPTWLRCLLVFCFMILALLYGFVAFTPYAPRILSSPPVLGAASIISGSLILWVPPNVILSAAMIGFGCRCIMLEHKKLEVETDERRTGTSIARDRERWGELERREVSRPPAIRDET